MLFVIIGLSLFCSVNAAFTSKDDRAFFTDGPAAVKRALSLCTRRIAELDLDLDILQSEREGLKTNELIEMNARIAYERKEAAREYKEMLDQLVLYAETDDQMVTLRDRVIDALDTVAVECLEYLCKLERALSTLPPDSKSLLYEIARMQSVSFEALFWTRRVDLDASSHPEDPIIVGALEFIEKNAKPSATASLK